MHLCTANKRDRRVKELRWVEASRVQRQFGYVCGETLNPIVPVRPTPVSCRFRTATHPTLQSGPSTRRRTSIQTPLQPSTPRRSLSNNTSHKSSAICCRPLVWTSVMVLHHGPSHLPLLLERERGRTPSRRSMLFWHCRTGMWMSLRQRTMDMLRQHPSGAPQRQILRPHKTNRQGCRQQRKKL